MGSHEGGELNMHSHRRKGSCGHLGVALRIVTGVYYLFFGQHFLLAGVYGMAIPFLSYWYGGLLAALGTKRGTENGCSAALQTCISSHDVCCIA